MALLHHLFLKTRSLLLYGGILAVLVFALKWLQWKFLIVENALDIYIGLIAVFFTILGIWIASQLARPKTGRVVIEKEVYIAPSPTFVPDEAGLAGLNLSNREYEVLQLLAKGHSNADIAAQLFLSLSTVKTHVSNLYLKMDVKRRTQAVEKARRLKIIA